MTALPQEPSFGDDPGSSLNAQHRVDPPHLPGEDLPALFRLPDLNRSGNHRSQSIHPTGASVQPSIDVATDDSPQAAQNTPYQSITAAAKVAESRIPGSRVARNTPGFNEIVVNMPARQTTPPPHSLDTRAMNARAVDAAMPQPGDLTIEPAPRREKPSFPAVDLALETWGSRALMITLLLLVVGFAALAVRGLRRPTASPNGELAMQTANDESNETESISTTPIDPGQDPIGLLMGTPGAETTTRADLAAAQVDVANEFGTDEFGLGELNLDGLNLGELNFAESVAETSNPGQSYPEQLYPEQLYPGQSKPGQTSTFNADSPTDVMAEVDLDDSLDFNDPFFQNVDEFDSAAGVPAGGEMTESEMAAGFPAENDRAVAYRDPNVDDASVTGSDSFLDPEAMGSFPPSSELPAASNPMTGLPDNTVTLGGPIPNLPQYTAVQPDPYAAAYEDTSMAYQYSRTPLGVTDWSRYFPADNQGDYGQHAMNPAVDPTTAPTMANQPAMAVGPYQYDRQ
ncbi:hypothetical protein [Stieleria varia]|nr:hypothetical protein [Stieleria varia]